MENAETPEKRDWHSYTSAQIREVELFDRLLSDLVSGFPPTRKPGPGRPPIPLSTLAWSAVKKQHTGVSSRRNQGYILEAEREGHIEKAPRYNAVSDFLNCPETTEILRNLVQQSAAPLAGIEQDFAIDSTGFACGNSGSYYNARYGQAANPNWVKLHACIGVRFNVVTDATVGAGWSGDSPRFSDLVRGTARRFSIRDVSADKAYSGMENHRTVEDLGGQALIPFKKKANPAGSKGHGRAGRSWRKAYHFFAYNQEEFLARYHKRSNAESAFAGIKATLGERLKSKGKVAQKNEVLCKVIAWNIRCVVRAMTEIGLEAGFLARNSSN